ncbi:hypothetical protein [Kitasatospora terrestris]|uniref:DUF11 domain-containing protein n=1 Tax=Kitasatospora terrestris TaxID=258051 RepID=A0ABP9DRJ8_9ACTN
MSSDKHPAEETPTERLLREALTARANQVTVHSLRQAAPPKRRLRKLKPVYAVTVPLFALAAASAGFYTIHGTPTAAKRDNGPAASVSATAPPTGDIQIPVEPSPSPSPSMTITPGGVPAIPQDYQSAAFTVTVDGLAKGTTLTAGADPLVFKVTFTNTTEVSFPKVVPALRWLGTVPVCAAAGPDQLQFDSGSGWKDSAAGDETKVYDQVQRGDGGFSLGPGESRTIKYRIRLDSHRQPADSLLLTAAAYGISNAYAGPSPDPSLRHADTLGSANIDVKVLPATTGPGSGCDGGAAVASPSATPTPRPSQSVPAASTSADPSTGASVPAAATTAAARTGR